MFGIHDFGLFLAAGILLNLTPGPDTLYILGGSIFHTCAAALGLSAILATSALAFGTIKLIGGAYLIFLGAKMILDHRKQLNLPSHFRRRTITAAFRQGILTNILNPKVALFFLAFLPQFIDPASSTKIAAFILLGLTFVVTGTIWCLMLAWFASVFSERLRANETVSQWLNRTAGALFVFLGLRMATSR
jgi:threonine/homoserine/homoserine lactone efflux protein